MLIFLARERAGFPRFYFPLVSDLLGEEWKGQRNNTKIQCSPDFRKPPEPPEQTENVPVLDREPLRRAGGKPLSPRWWGCKAGN